MACWVPFCDSIVPSRKGEKRKPGISHHQFPRDLNLKKKWIVAIGRKDPVTNNYQIPYKNSFICSLHFSPSQFTTKLKAGSIPYIFPNHTLPKQGTLIDEKELKLVNITEEEHVKNLRKYRKKSKKVSVQNSNIGNAKKRSFSEINSVDPLENNEIISRKINETDMMGDESDEGNNLDCELASLDDFFLSEDISLSDDECSTMHKNKNVKDKTKESFPTVNFTQVSKQDNIQIASKETNFSKSETNSQTKIVKLPLSLPEKNYNKDKTKQTFSTVNSIQLSTQNNIKVVNKAMSSNKSKPNSAAKVIEIPLAVSLNENSSFCPTTSIDPSQEANLNLLTTQGNNPNAVIEKQNKNTFFLKQVTIMKPSEETIIEPTLENLTENDTIMLNKLSAEMIENKRLTLELVQLQEENEDHFCSDDSIEEKISLYGIKELNTGVANADKKSLFLYDQLRNLTRETPIWHESTMEFANNLEENSPVCYDFLRKTNIINLPSPKNQRDDDISENN